MNELKKKGILLFSKILREMATTKDKCFAFEIITTLLVQSSTPSDCKNEH